MEEKKQEPLIIESDIAEQVFRIAICDDEAMLLEDTDKVVSKVSNQLIGKTRNELYSSSVALLEELRKKHEQGNSFPDLIIMDIEMPKMDGIEFGKRLREFAPDVMLIYLTSYSEYAVRGYEAKAFRYMIKPVTEEAMAEVFSDILNERINSKKLYLNCAEGESVVPLNEIIYISSEDKYSVVYSNNEHFYDSNSLNFWEKTLAPYGFYRIHRSYLVNMAYHRSLGKSHIILEGGIELPISRRRKMSYKKAVIQEMRKDILL